MERAAELGATTAVPGAFQLIYFVHASDHHEAEKMVHGDLTPYRKSASKEFFELPLRIALEALDRAGSKSRQRPRKRGKKRRR